MGGCGVEVDRWGMMGGGGGEEETNFRLRKQREPAGIGLVIIT